MSTEVDGAHAASLAAPVAGLMEMPAAVAGLTISDEDDYALAAEMLATVAGALKEVEEQRLKLTRPLNDVVRQINQAAKETVGGLPDASTRLRTLMADYRSAQEKARYDARVAEQAATGQAVVDPGSLPAPAARTVATSSGASVGVRKRWTFEVLDTHALAKECSRSRAQWEQFGDMVMPSPTHINAAVKGGLREFKGLRIFESESPVVR
jgi:hypothetical protein